MNKPDPDLTAEEQAAIDQDDALMEVLKNVNQNSGTSLQELFPSAIPVSQIRYWSTSKNTLGLAKLKQAIANGEDVNEKDASNYSLLHATAENGALEAARLLLAHGADASVKTDSGQTPLDIAKSKGDVKLIELFESVR